MEWGGRKLLGKYEMDRLLGRGGMGEVWSARHALTGRELAIKILDDSYLKNANIVQRFGREARAASAVQHPGIVEVLDIDRTEEGQPFIVMERLNGETLGDRIERRGRLSEAELVYIGTSLLDALAAAHAHQIVHRDLKPENIFVVPAGPDEERVKILDFGISHKADEVRDKLTVTGSVLGTPHYMSPEQAMGDPSVDHRADIYAAGVVLYECAVGDVPFDAPNYNALLRAILDETPTSCRRRGATISDAVERVIFWALEKDRERRIESAAEMRRWLERAAAGEMPPRPPVDVAEDAGGDDDPFGELDLAPPPPSAPPAASAYELDLTGATQSALRPPRAPSGGALKLDLDLDLDPERSDSLELDETALRASWPPVASPMAVSSERPPRPSARPSARPAIGVSGSYGAITPSASPPARKSGAHEAVHARSVDEARAGRPWAWLGGLVVLAAAGAGAWWWASDPPVDPVVEQAVPDESPTESEPARRRWVEVHVEGLPPGARLLLDGLPAQSPFRVTRGAQHELSIEAEGYEPRLVSFEATEDHRIQARLRPAR